MSQLLQRTIPAVHIQDQANQWRELTGKGIGCGKGLLVPSKSSQVVLQLTSHVTPDVKGHYHVIHDKFTAILQASLTGTDKAQPSTRD